MRTCRHANCQSLTAHFDKFRHYFTDFDYHVICMSETWLKPKVQDSMVTLQNYTLSRCDCERRQNGGVTFFLHNSLNAIILKQSVTDVQICKPEYITETNFSISSKLLLAVVYRPLHCGYLSEFE